MVARWGASSLIQSVQDGSVSCSASNSLTGTATIAAVSTANALLVVRGNTTSDATNSQVDAYQTGTIALTNATTVTVTRGGQDNNGNITVYFTVVEFAPGVVRSIQTSTIALTNGVTSNTAAISSVNTLKSMCFYTGKQSNQGALAIGTVHWPYVALTSAVLVTATRVGNVNLEQPGFAVVEFF